MSMRVRVGYGVWSLLLFCNVLALFAENESTVEGVLRFLGAVGLLSVTGHYLWNRRRSRTRA